MNKIQKLLIILLIFSAKNSFAQQFENDSTIFNNPKKSYTNNFFEKWYLHTNFEHFIDNYYDFTIHQLETTGDYSQPNPYTFSIMGGSYKWNQYTFNGFKINDMFMGGNALHKPYLFDNDVSINIYNSSVDFTSSKNVGEKVYLQWNHGTLGDRIWNADEIINSVTGHVSPYERLLKPIEYRRRVKDNILLMIHNIIPSKYGNLYQSIYLNAGQRMHTSFDYNGMNNYYPENYLQFHINGNLPTISSKIFDETNYLFTYSDRDQLFAEYYYNENETAKLKNFNFSLFGIKNDKYTTGINLSFKNIVHNQPNFSRNFIDVDGEGFEPWYVDGNSIEVSFNHKQNKTLSKHFSLVADFSNGLMIFNPKQNLSGNPIYLQDENNFRSLYYTAWEHKSFTSGLFDNEAGITYQNQLLKNILNFSAKFDITLDGFAVSGNSFIKPSWQFSVNAGFQIIPKIKISILLGKKQLPFDADYIRFFSADYMSGKTYYWNDNNNDKQFQDNEKGELFTTTGGKYHQVGDNMQQPYEIYFDVPIEIKAGKRSLFTITGQYRQYSNLWGITYTQNVSELGYYTNQNINIYQNDPADVRQIFFLNKGEVNYTTTNNYSELMVAGTGNNSMMYQNPFYSGLNLKYEYQSKKLYLSASFTAYMLVGFGSMGNGVLHNNLGVLSESMANPNTYLYYTGRLDADRSYIGRLLISYNINRRLSFAFQYKYKDGQSFNSFGVKVNNELPGNQVAIWNSNVKGDNPFTGQLSRREDCFYNTELRCKYTFFIKDKSLDINFSLYNLFDLGFQLAEYTFPPQTDNGKRWVLETQIPRGFMLSASLKL